ncbi:membrane protein [Bordetella trematum]|uniref:DUF3426 domain-containing protein n=1 Tax=Bordetella trematum TaxID=123899 RepID=UPI000793D1AE|nr:DUF3426 domain-containing protein [Bordetella trematum]SAI33505.1 membrane protein [Bordetella trematum]
MSLVTRCPNCGTAFKVVADQLRVRNGLVRCGECQTVFDGRACLQPSSAAAPVEPAREGAQQAPAGQTPAPAVLRSRPAMLPAVSPWRDEGAAPGAQDDDEDESRQTPAMPHVPAPPFSLPASVPEPEAVGAPPAAAGPVVDRTLRAEPQVWRPGPREPRLQQDDAAAEGLAVPGETRTRFSSATDSGRTPPAFMDDDHARASGRRWRLWAWACVLALLALGLQLAYVYRDVLATSAPPLRPALEAACRALGCEVGYPRRIERINITSSSLRALPGVLAEAAADGAQGRSRMALHVVMRNRYDKPQPWPALILELTDISDTVVARKVLLPQDYLKPAQAGQPFGAGEEVSLVVPVDVHGIAVNGYQLDKFFP